MVGRVFLGTSSGSRRCAAASRLPGPRLRLWHHFDSGSQHDELTGFSLFFEFRLETSSDRFGRLTDLYILDLGVQSYVFVKYIRTAAISFVRIFDVDG